MIDDISLKMIIQDNELPNKNGRVYSPEATRKAFEEFYKNHLDGKTYPIKDDQGNEYIACNPRLVFNGDSEDAKILSCSITADVKPTRYVADKILELSAGSLSIKSPI